MKKEILINVTPQEIRIAILENDILVELFVEKPEKERMVGNIYKGKVENVIDGMQAAFVDIGYRLNAFLPYSEIGNPSRVSTVLDEISDEDEEEDDLFREQKPRRNGSSREIPGLKSGQELLVQVIKEPFAGKGPRVTTDISIPGRLLVLVPYVNYIGISKKIRKPFERKRLKRAIRSIKPDGFGVIVRTVAEGKSITDLEIDLNSLLEQWKNAQDIIKEEPAPTLVYKDVEMTASVIRDIFTQDVSRILVDSKKLFKQLQAYMKAVDPESVSRLIQYKGRKPIFEAFNVEKEFARTLNRKVWLKSGGFLIIEHTEALVAIDVNSGKFIGRKDHEQNSLKINLEAAREIARQLRLRDIGGLIVIDFIDMIEEDNRKKVYWELVRELKKDRAKVAVAPISSFGILEMTRQRVRESLLYTVSEECPTCNGSGRVPSRESMVSSIESWMKRYCSAPKRELRVNLHVNPAMAIYLREENRAMIRRFKWRYFLKIYIIEDENVNVGEFRVFSRKHNLDITEEF